MGRFNVRVETRAGVRPKGSPAPIFGNNEHRPAPVFGNSTNGTRRPAERGALSPLTDK